MHEIGNKEFSRIVPLCHLKEAKIWPLSHPKGGLLLETINSISKTHISPYDDWPKGKNMNDLMMRRLRFLIMPTRFYPSQYEKDMSLAYLFWKSVWGQALTEEMNVQEPLYSDNFLKQSHVAAIFCEEEPFALATLNVMDLHELMFQDDSYFKVWPKESIEQLKSHSTRIMACGNLALNFKFRNNALTIPGKDLMLAMVIQYLKSTHFDSIIGTVRLEKGMERAAYRTGAISLGRDLPYTIPGQRVDLVCWKRSLELSKFDPELLNISNFIWTRSSTVVDRHFLKGEEYAAA